MNANTTKNGAGTMKLTTTRVAPGVYRTEYRGHEVQVLHVAKDRTYYGTTGGFWNIVVDGECDECADTKREALEIAQEIVDEMED